MCAAPFARTSFTSKSPFLSVVAMRHAFRSFVKSCQLSIALLGGGATRAPDAELPPFPSRATIDGVHCAHV